MADYSPHAPDGGDDAPVPAAPKKRFFGRGIYGSKDVPIRVLDKVILLMAALAIGLTVWNAVNGGFVIAFDANGADAAIADQKVRYGQTVAEPETPVRPGYTLRGWTVGADGALWDFAASTVTGDTTLTALWAPARFAVKFDLTGGTVRGAGDIAPLTVTYGEPYGPLPVPEKPGAVFGGWLYSGQLITPETTVAMTGEHVLTAVWR
jgi:uncharacterized repeat protein (TIGR02543 family)